MEMDIFNLKESALFAAIKKLNIKEMLIIGIVISIIVTVFVICTTDRPIVLSIYVETGAKTGDEAGVYHSFWSYDRDERYIICDASDPREVTVVYLNRKSENLVDAIQKGHIEIDELMRFDIDFAIRYS